MGKKVGKIFRGLLEKNGVKFKMGASVDKATPSKSDSSKVGAVHLRMAPHLRQTLLLRVLVLHPPPSTSKTTRP